MQKRDSLSDVDEINHYEDAVASFIKGEMDSEKFMVFRLQHGIYGQRQDGVHMVRIKLPGGQINSRQLARIADVLEDHSQLGHVQVTTRQDIQLHYVPLVDTPKIMRKLAEVGLTTRESCGNTVRNITACSMAAICSREHTNVLPFIDGAVKRFLRNPLTQHLPRKFKISFSGCEADCAMGSIHDVGVIAINRADRFGFKIIAGGGLGHKPKQAVVIEEFIEEKDLLPSIEAVLALHNRYSDRKKRAKSRIKFLVDKFGEQGFVNKYKEEFDRTLAVFAGENYPTSKWNSKTSGEICGSGAPRYVIEQRQSKKFVFPISLSLGEITLDQLKELTRVMEQENLYELRATIDQNLMLINVPLERVNALRSALAACALYEPTIGDNVVSCPGTSTCRLGITSSKSIATDLSGGPTDLRIRVSGCHNSCGQHHIGDIGIHGEGKRIYGKLIPHYAMHFGGHGALGGSIAIAGPSVPSARIKSAIEIVQENYLQDHKKQETFFDWARRKGETFFSTLLTDLSHISPDQLASLVCDYGDAAEFQVLQLGGGECAGIVQDKVASNFAEAMHEKRYRNAFLLQRKYLDAISCAEQILRVIGQALLFLAGCKSTHDLQQIASSIERLLPQSQKVCIGLQSMIATLGNLKIHFDLAVFNSLSRQQDVWINDVANDCQFIDKQLELMTSLIKPEETQSLAPVLIDISSYECPIHYIKAKNELRKRQAGEVVEFLLHTEKAAHQVSSSLAGDGHGILGIEVRAPGIIIKVSNGG